MTEQLRRLTPLPKRRACPKWMAADWCLLDDVPNVEIFVIRSRRYAAIQLARRPVQRRAHILFRVVQILERDLKGSAVWQSLKVGEDRRHNLLMLAIPALGHIYLL